MPRLDIAAREIPTGRPLAPGNPVKVLLTVYAKCLDGQQHTYNERIASLLGE